ncbi:MAG: DUF2156 domain-containing protein [Parachlamydiaceae bacterium]|nr:DUF2156 domain-containing protein [Parachlamydiaceae bacterium]
MEMNNPYYIDWIRRWGSSTTDAILDPSCKIFTTSNIPGMIGYRLEFGCVYVFGDPVCSKETKDEFVEAFHRYCNENQWNVIYVITSLEFKNWAITNKYTQISIEFGEELFIDPQKDPRAETGNHASLVRRKVKHAQNEGVTAHEYVNSDIKIEHAIEQVGIKWLKNRKGPQIHISNVHLFENRLGKRWFFAQCNDSIVGVLLLNKLEAHDGWLMNHLMITPEAPHGTPELLVVTALETVANENCHYVTFGATPNKEIKEIIGLKKTGSCIVRKIFSTARWIFNLDSRKTFWEKFHPQGTPTYLLFKNPRIKIKDIAGLMRAMNAKF